jgi:hypothetical protein
VGYLDRVEIEVDAGPDGAADRVQEYRLLLQAHFIDHLGDQAMYDAMAASGTVFRLDRLEALGMSV